VFSIGRARAQPVSVAESRRSRARRVLPAKDAPASGRADVSSIYSSPRVVIVRGSMMFFRTMPGEISFAFDYR